MSPLSIDTLSVFCAHPQQPLAYERIRELSNNTRSNYNDGHMRVIVFRIRKALADYDADVPAIVNVRKRQYQFTPEVTVLLAKEPAQ